MTIRRRVIALVRSSDRAQAAFAVEIAQLALEDLAAGLPRQRVEKLDVPWHLEIRQFSAQEILHGGG